MPLLPFFEKILMKENQGEFDFHKNGVETLMFLPKKKVT